MALYKKYRQLIFSPPVVILGISVLLLIISLYLTHRVRAYNSDDVSWQTILFTWTPTNGHQVTLGSTDNFVSKIPYFNLLESILPAGRKLLFIESALLAIAGFVLFYISSLYFLTKARIKLTYTNLMPFVWLASFGYSFVQLYLCPIWRGFEIGFSFGVFALVAAYFFGDIKPFKTTLSKIVTFLLTLIFGLFIYSDPYFLYFTLIPLLLFTIALLALRKINKTKLLAIFGIFISSLLVSKLVHVITVAAGIKMVATYPIEFISFDKFGDNIALTFHGLLTIFGADFFGEELVSLKAIGACINALLLGFIAYKIATIVSRATKSGQKTISISALWVVFFSVLTVFAIAMYMFSTVGVDLSTYRYFIICVLSGILILSLVIGNLPSAGKKAISGILLLATLLNLGVAIHGNQGVLQAGAQGNAGNSINLDLIHAVEANGLHKGYANYWQGSINTYLSRNKITSLPSFCANGKTVKFHWLIDEETFNTKSERSFYIVDPDIESPATCTEEQLGNQFGEPQEKIFVRNKTILIYNYDISSKM